MKTGKVFKTVLAAMSQQADRTASPAEQLRQAIERLAITGHNAAGYRQLEQSLDQVLDALQQVKEQAQMDSLITIRLAPLYNLNLSNNSNLASKQRAVFRGLVDLLTKQVRLLNLPTCHLHLSDLLAFIRDDLQLSYDDGAIQPSVVHAIETLIVRLALFNKAEPVSAFYVLYFIAQLYIYAIEHDLNNQFILSMIERNLELNNQKAGISRDGSKSEYVLANIVQILKGKPGFVIPEQTKEKIIALATYCLKQTSLKIKPSPTLQYRVNTAISISELIVVEPTWIEPALQQEFEELVKYLYAKRAEMAPEEMVALWNAYFSIPNHPEESHITPINPIELFRTVLMHPRATGMHIIDYLFIIESPNAPKKSVMNGEVTRQFINAFTRNLPDFLFNSRRYFLMQFARFLMNGTISITELNLKQIIASMIKHKQLLQQPGFVKEEFAWLLIQYVKMHSQLSSTESIFSPNEANMLPRALSYLQNKQILSQEELEYCNALFSSIDPLVLIMMELEELLDKIEDIQRSALSPPGQQSNFEQVQQLIKKNSLYRLGQLALLNQLTTEVLVENHQDVFKQLFVQIKAYMQFFDWESVCLFMNDYIFLAQQNNPLIVSEPASINLAMRRLKDLSGENLFKKYVVVNYLVQLFELKFAHHLSQDLLVEILEAVEPTLAGDSKEMFKEVLRLVRTKMDDVAGRDNVFSDVSRYLSNNPVLLQELTERSRELWSLPPTAEKTLVEVAPVQTPPAPPKEKVAATPESKADKLVKAVQVAKAKLDSATKQFAEQLTQVKTKFKAELTATKTTLATKNSQLTELRTSLQAAMKQIKQEQLRGAVERQKLLDANALIKNQGVEQRKLRGEEAAEFEKQLATLTQELLEQKREKHSLQLMFQSTEKGLAAELVKLNSQLALVNDQHARKEEQLHRQLAGVEAELAQLKGELVAANDGRRRKDEENQALQERLQTVELECSVLRQENIRLHRYLLMADAQLTSTRAALMPMLGSTQLPITTSSTQGTGIPCGASFPRARPLFFNRTAFTPIVEPAAAATASPSALPTAPQQSRLVPVLPAAQPESYRRKPANENALRTLSFLGATRETSSTLAVRAPEASSEQRLTRYQHNPYAPGNARLVP